MYFRPGLVFLLAALGRSAAQSQPPVPAQSSAEMNTREAPATFRSKVNVVLVPVVVRDQQGRVTGELKKEDFQLFDRHKPQAITSFQVEKSGGAAVQAEKSSGAQTAEGAAGPTPAEGPQPDHFTAYLFDDVHLKFDDLAHARDAAGQYLDASLAAAERAAIYTTSGRTTLEFTDDRAKLHETLLRIRPQPIAGGGRGCDPLGDCLGGVPQGSPQTLAGAQRNLAASDYEARVSLGVIMDVERRIAAMPGQRSITFISPGFFTLLDVQQDKTDILDRAIRYNIIISALNARGLYTIVPGGDASRPGPTSIAAANRQLTSAPGRALAEEDVLGELAYGTGGMYYHNNNDLQRGFERIAARPEYVYVLGFSPQNLKLDGAFHRLTITLKDPKKHTLEARRGYYAPRHLADPEETAKEEIEDAMFSREELRDIPVEMHTQFFKSSEDSAHLAVVIRVDVKHIPFRKEDGRNRDDLTVVAGLFDRNGNFVVGNQKRVELRLKDSTLEQSLTTGLTVKSAFDVKPGSYALRLVVRDSEGQMMAAANGAVEIP